MMTIAIVEDDKNAAENLRNMISLYGEENKLLFRVSEFPDAVSFLKNSDSGYDIVFMDIDMPGMDGMAAARELRRTDQNAILIFVTNMIQYAMDGYAVDALDFIAKPCGYPVFFMKMKRALSRVRNNRDEKILITTKRRTLKISIHEILYVEIYGHAITYHTRQGDYSAYGTMKKVAEQLDFPCFSFCKSCYLVNMRHVKSVQNHMAEVGDTLLPISYSKKKQFMEDLNHYIGGISN